MLSRGVLILALAASLSAEQTVEVRGEVSSGQTFRRDVGHGLVFQLKPTDTGWTIEIVPVSGAANVEFLWVATPPYRGDHPRYLDVSYGRTPTQTVEWSPRAFSFITNFETYKKVRPAIDVVLWPYTSSERQIADAQKVLENMPASKGELFILDSRISKDKIEWLKFRVRLTHAQE
jgi:hypothetical protein